jgi:hypothetical protein
MQNKASKDFSRAVPDPDDREDFGMCIKIEPDIKEIKLTRLAGGGFLGRFMFTDPQPIYNLDENGHLTRGKNKNYTLERVDGLLSQLTLPANATTRQIEKRLMSLLRGK